MVLIRAGWEPQIPRLKGSASINTIITENDGNLRWFVRAESTQYEIKHVLEFTVTLRPNVHQEPEEEPLIKSCGYLLKSRPPHRGMCTCRIRGWICAAVFLIRFQRLVLIRSTNSCTGPALLLSQISWWRMLSVQLQEPTPSAPGSMKTEVWIKSDGNIWRCED